MRFPFQDACSPCVELDVPWDFEELGYHGFKGVAGYDVTPQYKTMPIAEVRQLEVGRLLRPRRLGGAQLWLWTTIKHQRFAWELFELWGVEHRQTIPWLKVNSQGVPYGRSGRYWGRNGVELLMLATNSTSAHMLDGKNTPNFLLARNPGHSCKPDEAYEMIRRNSEGPRLSLFQRRHREGFFCWGDQLAAWGT